LELSPEGGNLQTVQSKGREDSAVRDVGPGQQKKCAHGEKGDSRDSHDAPNQGRDLPITNTLGNRKRILGAPGAKECRCSTLSGDRAEEREQAEPVYRCEKFFEGKGWGGCLGDGNCSNFLQPRSDK